MGTKINVFYKGEVVPFDKLKVGDKVTCKMKNSKRSITWNRTVRKVCGNLFIDYPFGFIRVDSLQTIEIVD